ncbi:aspartate aminotransferase [Achromobacter denitrificans]|uniref:Aminotransferase n=1 Tax=Achromobacter denitrificans TaxID=32002 RepID=A0A6N0JUK0_ACHDE|nr:MULTISPECIES: pyridoxal phosphate-dependent aminotransferase [Achromobacter]ASC65087.1 aspartate aminotransferase [Achromobacter denitrificans]QKQ50785.1 pyridoxal phosphate-dependent aminotransferase [Achromobacter denitrificans]
MNLTRESILAMPDSPIIDVWRLGAGRNDVIGLWAGESDLPTPKAFSDAATHALANGHTFYSQNRGIPALREAIAGYYARLCGVHLDDDRIAATSAGMNAVMLVAQAIISPGDNVVCITPSWPNILRAITIAGGEVRETPLDHDGNGWRLDLQRLFDACDARTRAIYYASPGNPTGWMLEGEQQRELLAYARERNIAIIADEVYQRIVYDRPYAPSMLEIASPDDPVFVINSFSKSWAMTGWRMGWLVYPRGMTDTFEKLIQFNTSGGQAFLQAGGVAALNDGEPFVRSFVERCRGGQRIVLERLAELDGVAVVPNQASFYVMFSIDGVTDTLAFCKQAVHEARVGLAPGVAFGPSSAGQIRLCYARSDEQLIEAMDRLQAFIRRSR